MFLIEAYLERRDKRFAAHLAKSKQQGPIGYLAQQVISKNIYFICVCAVDFFVSQTGHILYLAKHARFRQKTKFLLYNLHSHKFLVR